MTKSGGHENSNSLFGSPGTPSPERSSAKARDARSAWSPDSHPVATLTIRAVKPSTSAKEPRKVGLEQPGSGWNNGPR